MKGIATTSNARQALAMATMSQRQHAGQYKRVLDQRKRRIRGLWERNGAFYAQLTVLDEATGKKAVRRTRLEDANHHPVATVAEAVLALNKLKVKREENRLTLEPKRTPTLAEYGRAYLHHYELVKDAKRPATIRAERICLKRLCEYMGDVRLRQISKALVNGYMAHRQGQDVSARTVNMEVVTLRNVLRKAIDDGFLASLAIAGVKWLKYAPAKKRLVTHAEIEKICATALETAPVSGREFADFIKVMAYSGARWGEALRLRWQDVELDRRQLVIGAEGLSKNYEARYVDFNPRLEAHLKDMAGRRAPDSKFLFPSPRRGRQDAAAVTFNMTLRKVREKAGIPDFTCHLCRHFFASYAVMSGVDFMTAAKWLGHKDGGILIGKVYGHLAAEHTKSMAQKLNFEPAVVKLAATA